MPLQKRQQWIKIIKDDGETWDVPLLMKLRQADMTLTHLSQIFKLYKAEQRVAAAFSTPEVARTDKSPAVSSKKKMTLRQKSKMLYHLWKVPDTSMSPTEKFDHAVLVRNRHLGPEKATTLSPHLNVEVSADNRRMLKLNPDDLNMHKVLRTCNVKHGERRKVVKRALTMLGSASGMCGPLNGPAELKEIKACLQFGASLEEIKHAEVQRKKKMAAQKKKDKQAAKLKREAREQTRQDKLRSTYDEFLRKMGLTSVDQVLQSHVRHMTAAQCKAVAFCQCGVPRLKQKLIDELRAVVKDLLPTVSAEIPDDDAHPDTMAQDPDAYADGDESDTTATELVDFEDLSVGEIVEVYWEGEKKWYEGEVRDINHELREFEVFYPGDGETLWHKIEWYSVRSCE